MEAKVGNVIGSHAAAIDVQVEPPLAWITLSRAKRMNALDDVALAGIVEGARGLDARLDVHAVVLGAAGDDFCAGADLRLPSELSQAQLLAEVRRRSRLGAAAIASLTALRAPSVAAVRGRAIGGGFLLAAACDFCIASEEASFCLPEIDLGIPVGWGGVELLVEVLGAKRARELTLTCRSLSAEEACSAGLVLSVVPDAEVDTAAAALARTLATKAAGAVERAKQQFRRALSGESNDDVDLVSMAAVELLVSSGGTPLTRWRAHRSVSKPPATGHPQSPPDPDAQDANGRPPIT